jgi:TldD protein
MNIQADRDQVGLAGRLRLGRRGREPETYMIIKDGVIVDYQTTREQAPYLDWWYKKNNKPTRSHGNSYAQSWADVQFQRMPNVSQLPGEKDYVWEDLISATDRGIAIVGNGSFSIDQQRYNAQFGGQLFYEVKGGKVVGMLKDVAYQFRTPRVLGLARHDRRQAQLLAGRRQQRRQGAALAEQRGEPRVRPSRFRNVNIINTGRTA